MTKLERFAKRIERMQTPDKLRFAAMILEQTNDVDMALAVISQAVDHLMFVKHGAQQLPAAPTGLDDGPRCPYCGETVLVEFDPVSRRYVCLVCARTWDDPTGGGEPERPFTV